MSLSAKKKTSPAENGAKKTTRSRCVWNCQKHCVKSLVPLEKGDLCPSSSAKLSAQRSGAATQRNSKLCSARFSRCRSACKDWSSVKLTSEESFHGTSKHHQRSTSHPSSIIDHHLDHHAFITFIFQHAFIFIAILIKKPRGIQVEDLHTTRQMSHQIL